MKLIVVLLGITLAAGAQSQKRSEARGKPGEFDYYVLTLSWSPGYCASPAGARDTFQCAQGKRFAFVVHGLWPQYERGYPQYCAAGSKVSDEIVRQMLPSMPSARLIQHEWDRHGVCSGLSQSEYFKTIERAFSGVKVPDEYKAPIKQINVSTEAIRRKFVAANPGMSENAINLTCGGRFLSEVRVCLTKDLKLRPCSSEVRDTCRVASIIMQPVR